MGDVRHKDTDASGMTNKHRSENSGSRHVVGLKDMGTDVLVHIASFLDSANLARLATTCKVMRVAAALVSPPGLNRKISLMPHQQAVSVFLNRVGPSAMILDEPGTGKTLSVISYVLRTAGRLPLIHESSALLFADQNDAAELGALNVRGNHRYCGYLKMRCPTTNRTSARCATAVESTSGSVAIAAVTTLRRELAMRPLQCNTGALCSAMSWVIASLEGSTLRTLCISPQTAELWDRDDAGLVDAIAEVLEGIGMAKRGATDTTAKPLKHRVIGTWENTSQDFPAIVSRLKVLFSSVSTFETQRYQRAKTVVNWMRDPRFMFVSPCTLVVAPSALVHQWRHEIDSMTVPGSLRVKSCATSRGDFGTAASLAWDYDIILTSFERLSVEWSRLDSPLLRVHFMRIVLDEGHKLGSSLGTPLNHHAMCCKISAEQRIVMTGTPTPTTSTALQHLQPLLEFIRHPIMQRCNNRGPTCAHGTLRQCWKHVCEGFLREHGKAEASRALCTHLHPIIIRNLKKDIRGLGGLRRHRPSLIEFTSEQAKAYNLYCMTIVRNLLLADWYDPNHIESYVTCDSKPLEAGGAGAGMRTGASTSAGTVSASRRNLSAVYNDDVNDLYSMNKNTLRLESYNWFAQGKADTVAKRNDMISNLRSTCCVGGTAVERMYCTGCHGLFCPTCSINAEWNDIMVEKCASCKAWSHSFPNTQWCFCPGGPIDLRDFSGGRREASLMCFGGPCDMCHRQQPAVGLMCTPCSHVLCLECVAKDRFACTLCRQPYRQQQPFPRPEEGNPNPQHSVPQNLIESQPSFVIKMMDVDHGGVDEDDDNARPVNGENSNAAGVHGIGHGGSEVQQHQQQDEEDEKKKAPSSSIRLYLKSSKLQFLLAQVKEILWPKVHLNQFRTAIPPRILIFSEVMDVAWNNSATTYFPTHLNALAQLLEYEGIGHAKLMGKSSTRKEQEELVREELRFRNGTVKVCLLDLHHAQGWDLNYVTHVFLMEPLYDKSLEQQVISRAHRIGTAHTVHVMTLVMRDSIEDTVDKCAAEGSGDDAIRIAGVDVRLDTSMTAEDKRKCRSMLMLKQVLTSSSLPSSSSKQLKPDAPNASAVAAAEEAGFSPSPAHGTRDLFQSNTQQGGFQRRKRLRFSASIPV